LNVDQIVLERFCPASRLSCIPQPPAAEFEGLVATMTSLLASRVRQARVLLAVFLGLAAAVPASAADQVYFSAVDNVAARLVERINAETVRIDMSAWYLTDSTVYAALLNRHRAGVPVRLIGDRGSIFEIDQHTKNAFYYLASEGIPIRLRVNPTWYPEIAHWKATIFVGQNIVSFGSANYTPFELTPWSSTNYKDEVVLFTDDSTIVNAFKTKFDRYWNDTEGEPESLIPTAPYFKNWDDACATESACSDYRTRYPTPKPMVIDTRRLEPDYPLPPSMVWGQGWSFNSRLVTEINNEQTAVDFVIYRLTVDNITEALLAKHRAGVPVRLIIEPNEYLNRKWPEFWITHANIDKLWAAGIPIKWRVHDGLTHMKTLITSTIATVASANFAAAWQRDHNYFLSAASKPATHAAIKNRFETMWTDAAGFTTFSPQPPDAPTPVSPASGATAVSTTPTLAWNRAVFATSYDVYLGSSAGNMTLAGNVAAQLVNDPPATYSFTPGTPLAGNTTYYWRVVSRTNATPVNPAMVAASPLQSFTTAAGSQPPPGGSLPSPWLTQDVGAVGTPGSASYSNGTFTVAGAGADIWGSADAFRYAYQAVNGDSEIVARVTSMQNTHAYAKAGVMLRSGLTAGAAHVILDVRPDGWVEFMTRTSNGGATTYLSGTAQPPPAWLKLSRAGNTVTASVSSNGSSWTAIGTTPVSFSASAYMGLVVSSHNTGALNTSTFDTVSVSAGSTPPPPPPPPPSLPTPWTTQDVGSTGLTGSASHSNGTFTVAGAGADIWGTVDAFRYVSQPTSGDVEITARVTAIQNTHQWAKAGLMLRQSLTASSAQVLLDVTPGGTIEFMTRASNGAATTLITYGSGAAPRWLRLSRSGSTVTALVSSNGSTWTTLGSTTVTIPASANIGLAVTSHDVNTLNTSTFDNVSVSTSSTPPPPPPAASNVVIYASDIPASALHGSWSVASDAGSPSSVKLVTTDAGVSNPNNPLASPTDYVDVTFDAVAGTPYRIWLRLKALNNSKFNDAVWVQFSDALVNGAPAYRINTTQGLLVNLATDASASSLNGWGWQNSAYWLGQATTVTFADSGAHTLRIQIREDGVQVDQVVLSPTTYLNSAPGSVTNDSTIVPKP
jgi:phosphatidylserine/phosphatidylglycerophosphate/cardiolipin synthase-like enzyme/regulation of enolase protein 1 (concanavalin A-like superfamily)